MTRKTPLLQNQIARVNRPESHDAKSCPKLVLGQWKKQWENYCDFCNYCKVCVPCRPPCPNAPTPPPSPERTPSARRKKDQRANETPEQRESRLLKRRESRAQKSREASSEEKLAQREYERVRKNDQRARIRETEISEERDERLQRRREYESKLYGEPIKERQSPKRGNSLREYEKNRKQEQRARETSQQREKRLQKMRDYSAERRAKKATTISAKVKEATKERIAALRASRTLNNSPWDGKAHDPRKWKDDCRKEMEAKLQSGIWKKVEASRRSSLLDMEAIDPNNLSWHCPAGARCWCQYPQKCPKCKCTFFGCSAPCPRSDCDWKRSDQVEGEGTIDHRAMCSGM